MCVLLNNPSSKQFHNHKYEYKHILFIYFAKNTFIYRIHEYYSHGLSVKMIKNKTIYMVTAS